MSDTTDNEAEPVVSAELQKMRDRMAVARQQAADNKRARILEGLPPRKPVQRKLHRRTAKDARVTVEPAQRAEPAREASLPDEPVTRRRRSDRAVGSFDLPQHLKKPGWDYQWIAIRVLNEPVDSSVIMDFREGGWRPERCGNWPTLVEPGTPPDAPLERRGQRLYARPLSLTLEAQTEDLQYAQSQQRDRMMAAASGKSAIRGEEGMPNGRGIRTVPVSIEIEGVAG